MATSKLRDEYSKVKAENNADTAGNATEDLSKLSADKISTELLSAKDSEGDGGIKFEGAADTKPSSVIKNILEGSAEQAAKKKRKNKNKKKRANVAHGIDSKPSGEGGEITSEPSLGAVTPESESAVDEKSSVEEVVVENNTKESEEKNQTPTETVVVSIVPTVQGDKLDTLEDLEDGSQSAAIETVKAQPSVKVIFQSSEHGELNAQLSKSSHLIESEIALTEALDAAFGPSVPQETDSKNQAKLSQPQPSTQENAGNNQLFEGNQLLGSGIDVDRLEPEDIINNNYVRGADSQDFENSWNHEFYAEQESHDSFKIPAVPNPSLDNINISAEEQGLAASLETQQNLGKETSTFMNDRTAWKEKNPNFAYMAQFAVDEILEIASSRMELLLNLNHDECIVDEEALSELGFGLLREPQAKPSDSMNNLYQVEGDQEYAERFGTADSEYAQHLLDSENPGYLEVNGVTYELQATSPSENQQNISDNVVGLQQSEGFVPAYGGADQQKREEICPDAEISLNPFEISSAQLLLAEKARAEKNKKLLADKEDPITKVGSANPFSGFRLLDDVDIKETSESKLYQGRDSPRKERGESESHTSEEFFDARSNLSSVPTSTSDSPRSATECVEETLDASFNSKIQYFEAEVQKVVISASRQVIKRVSQSDHGLDSKNPASKVFSATALQTKSGEIGAVNESQNVGTSTSVEAEGTENILEVQGDKQEFAAELDINENAGGAKVGTTKGVRRKQRRDPLNPRGIKISEVYIPLNYDNVDWKKYTMRLKYDKELTPSEDGVDPLVAESSSETLLAQARAELDKARLELISFEELQLEYEKPQEDKQKCPTLKRALPCFHRNATPKKEEEYHEEILDESAQETQEMPGEPTQEERTQLFLKKRNMMETRWPPQNPENGQRSRSRWGSLEKRFVAWRDSLPRDKKSNN